MSVNIVGVSIFRKLIFLKTCRLVIPLLGDPYIKVSTCPKMCQGLLHSQHGVEKIVKRDKTETNPHVIFYTNGEDTRKGFNILVECGTPKHNAMSSRPQCSICLQVNGRSKHLALSSNFGTKVKIRFRNLTSTTEFIPPFIVNFKSGKSRNRAKKYSYLHLRSTSADEKKCETYLPNR